VLARIPVVVEADLSVNLAFVGAVCLLLRLMSVHFGCQLPNVIGA
jgi:hypothetical protein